MKISPSKVPYTGLRWARRMLIVGSAALTACGAVEEQRLASAVERQRLPGGVEVSLEGLRLRYQGEITTHGVAATRRLTQGRRIDELVIASSGGEINAGMDLGEWVHERGLTVVVDEYCLSSCANYVFTAAWQKVLARGAVVAWHGSARQQDLPAQLVRVVDDQIKALALTGAALEEERARRRREVSEYLARSIARQDAFFARIGVSEYVTRVGKERHGIDGLYSLSVADMGRFGISNVVALDEAAADSQAVQQKLDVRIVRLSLDDAPLQGGR